MSSPFSNASMVKFLLVYTQISAAILMALIAVCRASKSGRSIRARAALRAYRPPLPIPDNTRERGREKEIDERRRGE